MSDDVTDEEMIAARQALSGAAFAARSGSAVSPGALALADDIVRRLWQEVRRARQAKDGQ